jgi:hypothetical protein
VLCGMEGRFRGATGSKACCAVLRCAGLGLVLVACATSC